MDTLTYREVGATRGADLPSGYRHLRYRTRLPHGGFAAAAEAVLSWRMHRASGAKLSSAAPQAAPGVVLRIGLSLGPVRLDVPCQVVYVLDEPDRAGFGYGTLPGHLARGEEAFVVERDADGQLWFTVTAFSTPARWPMRLAGPFGRLAQRAYAHRLGRTLQRLLR